MTQARLDHVSMLRPILPLHRSLIQCSHVYPLTKGTLIFARHALSIDKIIGMEGSLMIHAFDQLRP